MGGLGGQGRWGGGGGCSDFRKVHQSSFPSRFKEAHTGLKLRGCHRRFYARSRRGLEGHRGVLDGVLRRVVLVKTLEVSRELLTCSGK